MLETLVARYYSEEDLSEEFLSQIGVCEQNARRALDSQTAYIWKENCFFHDWYVCKFAVYCEKEKTHCRITLYKRNRSIALLYRDVKSISSVGEWVSCDAQYPPSDSGNSFAQVLSIYLDHAQIFDCCLLLDNERYILIKAVDVEITEL